MAAQILRRKSCLRSQNFRCMPCLAGVIKHAAGQRDKVSLSSGDNGFRLTRIADHANGHCGQPCFVANVVCKAGLIAGADLNFLQRAVVARRHINEIAAQFLQFGGELIPT